MERMPALLLFACLSMLGGPAAAGVPDATELIDHGLKPILVKKPAFPFRSENAKDRAEVQVRLKLRSQKKNQITDDADWFHRNVLPRPPEPIEEDYRYVPADTRWGKLKFFRSGDGEGRRVHRVGVYELAQVLEEPVAAVYDHKYDYTVVLFDRDYVPVRLFVLEGFHPPILEINEVRIAGGILYFDCNYNGYASIMKEQTGYLVAVSLEDGSVLWSSAKLTSSYRGFLVYKDVILAGYGFTDEPDFLYVLDRHTGKVLQKEKLKSAHEHLVVKKDVLYVRCYDTDYEFGIVEGKRGRQ